MRMTKYRITSFLAVVLLLAIGLLSVVQHGDAAPTSGQPQYRLAAIDDNSQVQHFVLLTQGVQTMPNTTPIVGEKACTNGDADTYAAKLTLTGTMTGTNPVYTIALQVSDDDGLTWRQVSTAFAAINATVTPAAGQERITFADLESGGINTPVIWGDCFRIVQTWAGSGTVTANVGVTLYAE